ncbi:MAG: glycosyltransferase [Gemmatimonadaceae bacterium]
MTARTLFLNHSATMGGAEQGMLDLARLWRDSALAVLLEDGPFRHRLEQDGVQVHVIDAGAMHRVRRDSVVPSTAALASVWRAAREVAKISRDFDVILANSQKALIVGALATYWTETPLLWHLHDIIEPPFFSRLNIKADVMLANRRVERVVAVSRATADAFIRQGGAADKVHVVYNGTDAAPFEASAAQAGRVRADLGLSEVPLIGCFSRIAEWKGQHVLLDAVADLPGVHVLLVGGPLFNEHAYEQGLRDRVRTLGLDGRVHFLGHRPDVAELMRNVDLVVHPSTAPEPFARTLIESMFAGHAPIASACGGVPELIDSGRTGYLFPPGDVEALRAQLRYLLDRPDELMQVATQARAHAYHHFAMPAFAASMGEHLRAAAASRGESASRRRLLEVAS